MNKQTLKRGAKVRVYEDPVTKQRLEGIATLSIKPDSAPVDGLEYWHVKFDGDQGGYFGRWVSVEDIEVK